MATGRHIWTMTDHENDGFHPRNLLSTTPISTYDKNRAFGRPHSLLSKKKIRNSLTRLVTLVPLYIVMSNEIQQ
jgi:hypothetical protein